MFSFPKLSLEGRPTRNTHKYTYPKFTLNNAAGRKHQIALSGELALEEGMDLS